MRRALLTHHRLIRFAPLVALAVTAAGCSSSGIGTEASLSQAMASTSTAQIPDTTGSTGNLDRCPNVELRQGAGTYSINTAARDPSAMQLRYQVSIGQTARECRKIDGNLVMRVGVQGRVVLGPAGGPGSLDLPIRYAVVEEGMQPKTVFSKMEKVPVSIGENQPHLAFTHIEEQISVPMPTEAALEKYILYVGFDTMAPQEKKPAAKRGRN